jgi:hypothetical protein
MGGILISVALATFMGVQLVQASKNKFLKWCEVGDPNAYCTPEYIYAYEIALSKFN